MRANCVPTLLFKGVIVMSLILCTSLCRCFAAQTTVEDKEMKNERSCLPTANCGGNQLLSLSEERNRTLQGLNQPKHPFGDDKQQMDTGETPSPTIGTTTSPISSWNLKPR
ncbi:hypothetical protein IV203_032132 [Nitzschia inconspicua]|uniref:Secreted protein n=1 Tax=Nitzschia inconspicua TaxID=303405 RepID=A0A9K3Q5Q9_9STRA|nr:hypothetical protein IV203_032132 [Nitzschia inconspicua]